MIEGLCFSCAFSVIFLSFFSMFVLDFSVMEDSKQPQLALTLHQLHLGATAVTSIDK